MDYQTLGESSSHSGEKEKKEKEKKNRKEKGKKDNWWVSPIGMFVERTTS